MFYWTQDRHFTLSCEPCEGLAVCRAKAIPSFPSYLKTLNIGPAPGIKRVTSRSAVKCSSDWFSLALVTALVIQWFIANWCFLLLLFLSGHEHLKLIFDFSVWVLKAHPDDGLKVRVDLSMFSCFQWQTWTIQSNKHTHTLPAHTHTSQQGLTSNILHNFLIVLNIQRTVVEGILIQEWTYCHQKMFATFGLYNQTPLLRTLRGP